MLEFFIFSIYSEIYICTHLKLVLWFIIFRQEDRDTEHGSSHSDVSEKLARLSTDYTSVTDWHLGFHIFLVSWICLLNCLCFMCCIWGRVVVVPGRKSLVSLTLIFLGYDCAGYAA